MAFDDGIEKDCHNLAEYAAAKLEVRKGTIIDGYAVACSVAGVLTLNIPAFCVGSMRLASKLDGTESLVAGKKEVRTGGKVFRLTWTGALITFDYFVNFNTSLLLDLVDYLAQDSDTLRSSGEFLNFCVDRFGTVGAALYLYLIIGDSGDGLKAKTKDLVNRILETKSEVSVN